MNGPVVSQNFWPGAFRVNNLVEGLDEQGYSATILAGKPNYPDGFFLSSYALFSGRYTRNT